MTERPDIDSIEARVAQLDDDWRAEWRRFFSEFPPIGNDAAQRLIRSAPDDVTELVAYVRHLEHQRAELRDELSALRHPTGPYFDAPDEELLARIDAGEFGEVPR